MSKRSLILMCSIFLIVPLLFMGCGSDGSDGARGPQGIPGQTGDTGPAGPGTVSNESCVVCHGQGQAFDVRTMHQMNADGTMMKSGTVEISGVSATFGAPNPDNTVPVSVTFTFNAKNSAGTDITGNIDLRLASSGNLTYSRFTLARFVPGQTYDVGTKDPNEWYGYVLTPGASGSGPFASRNGTMTGTPSTGVYTYTFPASAVTVSDGFDNTRKHRVGIQISGLPATAFQVLGADLTLPAPVANATLDVVPDGSTVLATKDVVTTAACNQCHDPLAIHGGGRIETKLCVTCHNAKIEIAGNPAGGGWDNGNLVRLIHGVHQERNLGSRSATPAGIGDFSEVTYPQDIRNCDTCHKGTDGDNYKNLPSIEACGSCHRDVNFATGANHPGGVQTSNRLCGICHAPELIVGFHADNNATPNNVPVGLDNIVYFIDNVTMSGNFPVVTFHITKNGANLTIPADNNGKAIPPTGYTGTPAFLLAFAMPQDGITTPADYNNLGNALVSSTGKNGQPESVNITGLTLTGSAAAYTTTLTKSFPAGATMRAVALQSYWSQTVGGVSVGRHTPAVVKAVNGDTVRRAVVDSNGCAACHKRFEGHGGSRVHNVQVCVICHNPNMTSSGRTIDPAIVGGINSDITALFGTDPLAYPEVSNNFRNLIHGIHSRDLRSEAGGIEFVDIRNRLNGVLILGNEVTFPGNLKHCTKCHIGTSYKADLPPNLLLSTTKETTGDASETRTQIIAARNQPNATDLVNSPIATTCYGCHASIPMASHAVQMGGDINSTRAGALLEIPWDLTLTP